MLCTHTEGNLLFACKGKFQLATKGTTSLSLFHTLLILATRLLTAPPVAPINHQNTKNFSTI